MWIDSTAYWARLSRNEHMPVGELVAIIDSNELQALSDDNIDEVRSACHDAAVLFDGDCQLFILAIADTSNMGERLGLAQS